MRTCFRIILFVAILAAIAVGNSPVSAQTCTIKPNSIAFMSPQYNSAYYNGVVVPVSATCSFVGGQLYAVGKAVDASTNAPMGSASPVLLTSAYGTNIYVGRLSFLVPREATSYRLQVTISIYSAYFGYSNGAMPLATSVQTGQVNPSVYYGNFENCNYTNSCAQIAQVYNACHSPTGNDTVKCVGYLYQNSNSCIELVIPIYAPYGAEAYQYFTLQKLPSSYPAIGTWVTVTGQLYQGPNASPTGAGCPGNYINVASISNSTS